MSSRTDLSSRAVAGIALAIASIVALAAPALAQTDPNAPPAADTLAADSGASLKTQAQSQPSTQASGSSLNFAGHGWGHGRGMGQWGAFGYAVDHSSSASAIVDHFYGNTAMAQIPNPQITVRIVGQDGLDLVVTSDSNFHVGGIPISGHSAGHLIRRPDGQYDLYTRYDCLQSDVWYAGIVDPTAVSDISDPGDDVHKMVAICQQDQSIREYRGSLTMTFGDGANRTINTVNMEDYLRGVVPRESPASWGDSGNGKGMQALEAQAIAARSYALAEGGENGGRYSYAKTCDTTSCQVYGGAGLDGTRIEDPRSDNAVAQTGGLIRRFSDGTVARTEFSSSTGGWTAGGVFPAVEDTGDVRSPFHNWSASVPVSSVESTYGVGSFQSLAITSRNGLGDDGGRALSVKITGSSRSVTVTGNDVQSQLGLRSNWFLVSNVTPPIVVFERNSNTTGAADTSVTIGQSGGIALACDWNGTGKDSPAVFNGGGWTVSNTNTDGGPTTFFQFGDAGDIPICGDWNGDGKDTPGVFRKGTFYLRNSNSTGTADMAFGFGNPTDQPVAGDWDGDGKTTIGVFRDGVFYLRNSNSTGPADGVVGFGSPGDIAITGNWNNDPFDTIGVWRNGGFYLRNSNSTGVADITFGFGNSNDAPLVGDWTGTKIDSPGVARSAS
jgi:SpoIID/LytB domain protein